MSCWRPAVDLCVFYSKIRQTGSAFRDKQMLEKEEKKKSTTESLESPKGDDETVKRGDSALELIYSTNGVEEAGHRPHYTIHTTGTGRQRTK